MGLSLPGRVISIEPGGVAVVLVRGAPQRVRLRLLAAERIHVTVGDWVLVQVGLAVAALDPTEADDLLRLIGDEPAPTDTAPAPTAIGPAPTDTAPATEPTAEPVGALGRPGEAPQPPRRPRRSNPGRRWDAVFAGSALPRAS